MRLLTAPVLLRVELLPDSAGWKIENAEECGGFTAIALLCVELHPASAGFKVENEDEHEIFVRHSVAACRASVWFCNFVDRQ